MTSQANQKKYNTLSLETRKSIIRMYMNDVCIVQISRNLNIPYTTVCSVVKKYLKDGKLIPDQKGGAYNLKCTEEIKTYLNDLLNEECTRTLNFLKIAVSEKFGVNLSISAIQKNLRSINFSLKQTSTIPERRNNPEVIEKRYVYALRYDVLSGIHLRKNFVFVDEAGFSVSMRRNRGWSKKGSRANTTVPAIRARNFSVCAAITIEGVMLHRIKNCAYNGQSFYEYLSELMEIINNEKTGQFVIIMDNATIHRVSTIRQLVEDRGHILEYLPPYSPFLNPIENCFSKWKGYVKSRCCESEEDLMKNVFDGFQTITQADCEGWLRNMLRYINESRLKNPITD